jgi:hypothetical protein
MLADLGVEVGLDVAAAVLFLDAAVVAQRRLLAQLERAAIGGLVVEAEQAGGLGQIRGSGCFDTRRS